jgi:hypothetical protein
MRRVVVSASLVPYSAYIPLLNCQANLDMEDPGCHYTIDYQCHHMKYHANDICMYDPQIFLHDRIHT